ncbi:preprotein translocase subunit SecA [Candidatus Nomurabacteria bacterium]|uniref:Protein translocase subunit SecA n=1 Tax=candidate division WWE3 bacterium TaxID=2053526 RepID=A0A955IVK7_UNCKA|nr:preprotein translocase subunit SecA [candidate division WWE3 bacterium]MCB9823794.1 preprotein translocase subunit SecA [Candidatus Nomurabacteria bacterium]MCB9826800.1 preprotein translocase subunit SecA [Candidatus Nomurabacteria bacterium]MCB9827589.1 preprotein translocase subunit SecA [Candidatus Nomurabacteria bacterium]
MFKKFFDTNSKLLAKQAPILSKISSFEPEFERLDRPAFLQKTAFWKEALSKMDDKEASRYMDSILPEAFALVREAARRVLSDENKTIRIHDVQMLAGIALHQGKVAEQKTGEGKTLTAVLPLYLNALTGKGAHLVTPNDYLSKHGAGWMGGVYDYLGLKTGVIMQQRAFIFDPEFVSSEFQDEYTKHLREISKADAYRADITYGTNHEFGFDYLRDNMVLTLDQTVQTNPNGDWGSHNFAIVDEVDSILIDVARTPLIISTSSAQPTERYMQANRIIDQLEKNTDYEVEEKFRNASLTDFGIRRVENLLKIDNLYEQDFEMVHLIEQSLSAHALYEKDRDYVVKDGQVVIVDQFTGRLLPSNRFSQGLHQAIEAKENVQIQQESKTVAEISYQNYFRMYSKLAGMTGTAVTEAEELFKIYKLEVVVIPTHMPVARIDYNDVVYKTEAGKFKAVADEIAKLHEKGQPVLVGTTTVEKSELLHNFLQRRKIPHEILNAKNHEREALIVAQAGKKGAVTISTNMAGRGVDIILGGDPSTEEEQAEIRELGGLHVIGTERHESRRIDNQLRGRSGRQGDPGSSRFYVSLQDDLMRVFGGAQVERLMNRFGIDDSVPLEAGIVSKAIENAQKKVENFNFDRRKQVVEMDDVMNVHREVVYKLRRRILEIGSKDLTHKDWFLEKLSSEVSERWDYYSKELGEEIWAQVVAQLSVEVVDMLWMEHLVDMDNLRDGIGLRGYAQKDPIVEYKREGHTRFDMLVDSIYSGISERLLRLKEIKRAPEQVRSVENRLESKLKSELQSAVYEQGELNSGVEDEAKLKNKSTKAPTTKSVDKIGRNDPCPCGSGKKYKKCHGKDA